MKNDDNFIHDKKKKYFNLKIIFSCLIIKFMFYPKKKPIKIFLHLYNFKVKFDTKNNNFTIKNVLATNNYMEDLKL